MGGEVPAAVEAGVRGARGLHEEPDLLADDIRQFIAQI
jgi:hypothetical protein